MDAPTGTLIAYATAPGRVASDGAGQNGLYTSELLKQMRVPGLTATDMFMRVRGEVMKQTANKQVPWEASSLVGSYYFSGGANSTGSNAGPPNASPNETRFDPAAFELSYWESIKTSTDPDDFKAYLEKYPAGQFATLAKNRIRNLEAVAKPEPKGSSDNTAELAFWESVKNSTNVEDFRAYLKKYPQGEFVDLANNRIASLEAALRERDTVNERNRATNEAATQTKFFVGKFGVKLAWSSFTWNGKLEVARNAVEFICDGGSDCGKAGERRVLGCASFASAVVDKSTVREIAIKSYRYRFTAQSPTEAAAVIDAVRHACTMP